MNLNTLGNAIVFGLSVGVLEKATRPLREKQKETPKKQTKSLGLFK
jgi:hypothetical protein